MPADSDRTSSPAAAASDGLFPALLRLDRLLGWAAARVPSIHSGEVGGDRFRGLYISRQEVERLLAREPGAALFGPEAQEAGEGHRCALPDSRLARLVRTFRLESFDLDVLLLALAPEVDLRYERLYAYLQDDVSRCRPTVDLVLSLLCRSARDRIRRRAHFGADSVLVREGIVELVADPAAPSAPFLSRALRVDEQIVNLLLRQDALDRRLVEFCRLGDGEDRLEDLGLDPAAAAALPALVARARADAGALRLAFHGPPGTGKRRAAGALAARSGSRLLTLDVARLSASALPFAHGIRLACREAWLRDATLYIHGMEALAARARSELEAAVAGRSGITILSGLRAWTAQNAGVGLLPVPFGVAEAAGRRTLWSACLTRAAVPCDDATLHVLADRFRLTAAQIAGAVEAARGRAAWRAAATHGSGGAGHGHVEAADLFASARAQSGHELAGLATRVEPRQEWDDLVLPETEIAHLREICVWLAQHDRVLDQWGFGAKLTRGRGVNALFSGPSGTGKTLAAEIMARELELDLFRIDLAGVVSKYIGETEKNLDRIFAAAEGANGILFFDEADALFGKRSEVRDSHDRYANLEISYLLQKMEQFEGFAILATNLRSNLDEAFMRRLAFVVHFSFPDEASRGRIWERIWPRQTPLAPDVDLGLLARQFKLSGGNIKNIALAAAFAAAEDGGVVTMAHLLHATHREYQKLGKTLSPAEIGRYSAAAPAEG